MEEKDKKKKSILSELQEGMMKMSCQIETINKGR